MLPRVPRLATTAITTLLTTVAFAFTASPAAHADTSVNLPAAANLTIAAGTFNCGIYVNDSFSGVQNSSGTVTGEWLMDSDISCNFAALKMHTSNSLFYDGGMIDSVDGPTELATSYTSASKYHYCAVCNGTWFAEGYFQITVGGNLVWTSVPPGCYTDSTKTTIYCALKTNTVTL